MPKALILTGLKPLYSDTKAPSVSHRILCAIDEPSAVGAATGLPSTARDALRALKGQVLGYEINGPFLAPQARA